MTLMLALSFLVLGSIVGSFLNVVILRYNTSLSFGGRSACLSCQTKLRPKELIPLLSFFLLRGRCLTCKTKISFQYPLVELTTGLVFFGLFLKLQSLFFTSFPSFVPLFVFYALLFSLLIIIVAYDIRHKIIPDPFVFLFSALAFLGLFFFSDLAPGLRLPGFWELVSGVLLSSPFAILWILSRGAWIGLGDAKLVLGLGYFLGLPVALTGILLAFWSGAVVGVLLLVLSRRYNMKSEIPFAPFLVFGGALAFFTNFIISF